MAKKKSARNKKTKAKTKTVPMSGHIDLEAISAQARMDRDSGQPSAARIINALFGGRT
jgi:hypothetical protein